MTLDETKQYIEQRLQDMGWAVSLDKGGYEKVYRYTDGSEVGLNQVYHRLLSLGSLRDQQQITGDLVSVAVEDLAHKKEEPPKRTIKSGMRHAVGQESDRMSIEQLAATLESKVSPDDPIPVMETRTAKRKPGANGGGSAPALGNSPEKKAKGQLPKILVVDDSAPVRTAVTRALVKDFVFVEVSDGEEAWQTLVKHPEIQLIVTDLVLPGLDGYELIKRVRAALAPDHIVGIPIVVVTAMEDTNAKLRALVAGANDFITKSTDAHELRARVLARYEVSRDARQSARYRRASPSVAGAASVAEDFPDVVLSPAMRSPRQAKRDDALHATHFSGGRPMPNTERLVRPYGQNVRIPPRAVEPDSFFHRLYQVSSSTTITLTATVLVAVAITIILYVSRDEGGIVAKRAQLAPPVTQNFKPAERSVAAGPIVPTPTPEPTREKTAEEMLRTEPSTPVPPAPSKTGPKPGVAESSTEALKAKPAPVTRAPAETSKTERKSTAAASTVAPVVREDTKPVAPIVREDTKEAGVDAFSQTSREGAGSGALDQALQPGQLNEALSPAADVARAEPARPPAPPVVARDKISKDELTAFVRRFAFVYEAGDLDQFVGLFADNARTNDRTNRSGIREDYAGLFRNTDLRQMALGHVNWEVDSRNAHGWGNFEVTVRQVGQEETNTYTGSLTFFVEKVDGKLRIVRLHHGQRRASLGR